MLHLGQDDLPLPIARSLVGPETLIGLSTHDFDQATRASAGTADYCCVGPCWPTPTKPGRSAPGLDLVRAVAGIHPAKPWFAIGGIDEQRVGEVLAAGARRIVVVRALTEAGDPAAAARRLVQCWQGPRRAPSSVQMLQLAGDGCNGRSVTCPSFTQSAAPRSRRWAPS